MDNPFVIGFVILLLIIFMMSHLLLGAAEIKIKKEKEDAAAAKKIVPIVVMLFLFANPLLAQSTDAAATATVNHGIAGVSTTAFYIMASIIFLELLVILVLLMNVRILLKVEKAKAEKPEAVSIWKARFSRWWIKINNFKSKEQEADINLGHDYDGIRELDSRLPPWWLYGFYLTIIAACIYLYRFHVSHTGPSAVEEYQTAIAKADIEVKQYLKSKGDAVDENTVTMLTGEGDLAEGKTFFAKSCVTCHNEGGAGNDGPNLTDDYWLHGGDIKSIFKTIRYGINAMPQWQNSYSNKQIAELASYVKSLKGTKPTNPKAPQGVLETDGPVPGKPGWQEEKLFEVGFSLFGMPRNVVTGENSAVHYNESPYDYVGNNPINFIDTFGLDTSRPGEKTLQNVDVTAKAKTTTSPSVPFWQLPIFTLGTLFPKRWIGPVLPNSSELTTLTSYLLGKMKTPINVFGKRRLFTHTLSLNGSARYASTWGRFLGRWGSKVLGTGAGALFYYDLGNYIYKNWRNLTPEQKRDNYRIAAPGGFVPSNLESLPNNFKLQNIKRIVMNIDDNLEDEKKRFVELVSFLREQTGVYKNTITRETLIEDDLGVTGEDGYKLIQNFSKEYKINITRFDFGKYFNDEPVIFAIEKKIWPFTVGHLEKPSLQAG